MTAVSDFFTVGPIITTAACEEATMQQEQAYLAALESLSSRGGVRIPRLQKEVLRQPARMSLDHLAVYERRAINQSLFFYKRANYSGEII
ncbi:MAG: hypothetical protein IPJ94_27755 [Chloroflexi bacterium]|nr:hypothetical protein [Chloroflexota bacterium]